MRRYRLVAMGGTFDILHRGHVSLLSRAFAVSDEVIIGLVSDEFAARRGKRTANAYPKRLAALRDAIRLRFPGRAYRAVRLDDEFGPAVLEVEVGALVVSQETCGRGEILNRMRRELGIPEADIVVVPMEMASDGRRISSTRIRNREIAPDGGLP